MNDVTTFDMTSYIMGLSKGNKTVVLEGDEYTFTDPQNDGNIVVTKEGE